jgi:branched-subunit amino acid aminotransferase/4-amino-4-deoxychorismate lyase
VIVYRAHGPDLERLPVLAGSFDDATLQTGHGIYSVFRLYPGGRVLRFSQHLDRMRRSAAALRMPYTVTHEWLRDAVRRAVEASGIDVPRARLTIPYAAPDSALIALEPFSPLPWEVYLRGVRAALAHDHRTRPAVKDSRFIERRRELASACAGAYEILLCSEDGRVLEGASSNFYAVLDGVLHTADAGMLRGISRGILLEVAPRVVPVIVSAITIADLPRISEAMMTSASRGVVPIVQIDDQKIGSGFPGAITQRLIAAYDAQVESELEPL